MRLVYINPNSTETMTDAVVAVARAACPEAEVTGRTNRNGPPAIQGAEDGAAAVPGLLDILAADAGAYDAGVIACFDDTGLAEARAAAPCPVLGIGQAAYLMASILGGRFSVVTSVAAAVPVITGNLAASGMGGACISVSPSNLPVLAIDTATPETRDRLAQAIRDTAARDDCDTIVLGCAGMAALRPDLEQRTGLRLVDGVAASALLARAAVGFSALPRH